MSARRLRLGPARHHQGNREPISIASLFKMGADRAAKPVAKGFRAARASWLAVIGQPLAGNTDHPHSAS